ncbi:hypothetical protein [Slackia heliotrinireducens]|uniref:Uncharacterized protein n=1 Tax=Slackia heliotrinireducens (strain ATCC 29202 / DSM 20476 / NCTC 11029 / RHS 1) TaxID=471855 RepID=C7N103_SLAHD|nr:hypothetical protein [Slackia heliotrinireducens]ACV23225.1 hypothetical protein Shel_22150 [Slackia heliotrinireducens DSM 20476]
MADCEYTELFNSCLLDINPLAPTVDPDEFRRIVDMLECDELTALYVLGTHVPPEHALILNRKLPPSILENSYLVKQVKKDLVTVTELANTFKVPVSEVSDFLRHAPLDSRGRSSWLDKRIAAWERLGRRLAMADVIDVVWGSGSDSDEVRAVKAHTQAMPDGEYAWLALGQTVRVEGWPVLECPVRGVIEAFDLEYGLARIASAQNEEAWPAGLPRLVKLQYLMPLENVRPKTEDTASDDFKPRKRMDVRDWKRYDKSNFKRLAEACNALEAQLYEAFVCTGLKSKAVGVEFDVECDVETAMYVAGTQQGAEDRHVVLVNRCAPPSDQPDAYVLDELRQDMVTVLDVANCFWQPVDLVRKQLAACDYDLASSEGQAHVAQWRISRQRMREHGLKGSDSLGVVRDDGMGPNEARAVVFCRKGSETESVLIVGRRARVGRGTFAGLEGDIVSLAPEDGLVGVSLAVDGGSGCPLSALVRFEDIDMLPESKK